MEKVTNFTIGKTTSSDDMAEVELRQIFGDSIADQILDGLAKEAINSRVYEVTYIDRENGVVTLK